MNTCSGPYNKPALPPCKHLSSNDLKAYAQYEACLNTSVKYYYPRFPEGELKLRAANSALLGHMASQRGAGQRIPNPGFKSHRLMNAMSGSHRKSESDFTNVKQIKGQRERERERGD